MVAICQNFIFNIFQNNYDEFWFLRSLRASYQREKWMTILELSSSYLIFFFFFFFFWVHLCIIQKKILLKSQKLLRRQKSKFCRGHKGNNYYFIQGTSASMTASPESSKEKGKRGNWRNEWRTWYPRPGRQPSWTNSDLIFESTIGLFGIEYESTSTSCSQVTICRIV